MPIKCKDISTVDVDPFTFDKLTEYIHRSELSRYPLHRAITEEMTEITENSIPNNPKPGHLFFQLLEGETIAPNRKKSVRR